MGCAISDCGPMRGYDNFSASACAQLLNSTGPRENRMKPYPSISLFTISTISSGISSIDLWLRSTVSLALIASPTLSLPAKDCCIPRRADSTASRKRPTASDPDKAEGISPAEFGVGASYLGK